MCSKGYVCETYCLGALVHKGGSTGQGHKGNVQLIAVVDQHLVHLVSTVKKTIDVAQSLTKKEVDFLSTKLCT